MNIWIPYISFLNRLLSCNCRVLRRFCSTETKISDMFCNLTLITTPVFYINLTFCPLPERKDVDWFRVGRFVLRNQRSHCLQSEASPFMEPQITRGKLIDIFDLILVTIILTSYGQT